MSPDEEKVLGILLGAIKDAIEKGLVATIDPRNGEMPIPWDSADGGMAFEYNNVVMTFQVRPKCMADLFAGRPVRGNTHGAKYKIHCAMACYYKKGMNPRCPNERCKSPFLVMSQMEELATANVFIRKYTPGEFQDRPIPRLMPNEEAFQAFMAEVLVDSQATPTKLDGGLKEASILVTGEDLTRSEVQSSNSGCLGILLLLVGMPVALFLSKLL